VDEKTSLGFIGVGNVGGSMARNLLPGGGPCPILAQQACRSG